MQVGSVGRGKPSRTWRLSRSSNLGHLELYRTMCHIPEQVRLRQTWSEGDGERERYRTIHIYIYIILYVYVYVSVYVYKYFYIHINSQSKNHNGLVQALSESEPQKLRKRCTPPVDKHQLFGTSCQRSKDGKQDRTSFCLKMATENHAATKTSTKRRPKIHVSFFLGDPV